MDLDSNLTFKFPYLTPAYWSQSGRLLLAKHNLVLVPKQQKTHLAIKH